MEAPPGFEPGMEVLLGTGTGPTLRAGFENPIWLPATYDIGHGPTRFLRLRQVGTDGTYYWSVGELSVRAPRRS